MRTKPFDIATMLETEKDVRDFLEEAAKGTPAEFVRAVNIAGRAVGMTEVASRAGVTRASLYKSLAEGGNPRFETISNVVEALGCKLTVSQ